MFGRKGNYSTLEGDSQLLNVNDKDHDNKANRKFNRRVTMAILAGLCVVVLLVVILVPIIVVNSVHKSNTNSINGGLQCPEPVKERVDCYPERDGKANSDTCNRRGCCWVDDGGPTGAPYCYFPISYGYTITNVTTTNTGMLAHIHRSASKLPYPAEVLELKLEAYYETDNRLRVKVDLVFYCINISVRLFVCV